MIKQIWFDFGNIFIPIYPERTQESFKQSGVQLSKPAFQVLNAEYEIGALTTHEFLQTITISCKYLQSSRAVGAGWDALLGEMNDNTLFLRNLSRSYATCLVSNTNEAHITTIQKTAGSFLWNAFINQFEELFLSYQLGMRKPNANYFEHVLEKMNAVPEEVLFIDDTLANLVAAEALGIQTWQFNAHEGNLERELPAVLAKLNKSASSILRV